MTIKATKDALHSIREIRKTMGLTVTLALANELDRESALNASEAINAELDRIMLHLLKYPTPGLPIMTLEEVAASAKARRALRGGVA